MYVSDVHPKAVGDTTTAMILARLIQAGKVVLLPFGENLRYDLLIDEKDLFVRVQCKTGRLRGGAIWFPTCSNSYHHPKNRGIGNAQHPYHGQADLFGVYCPELDRVYLVPVAEVGGRTAAFRVSPTKNNQAKRIRWARGYELSTPG